MPDCGGTGIVDCLCPTCLVAHTETSSMLEKTEQGINRCFLLLKRIPVEQMFSEWRANIYIGSIEDAAAIEFFESRGWTIDEYLEEFRKFIVGN